MDSIPCQIFDQVSCLCFFKCKPAPCTNMLLILVTSAYTFSPQPTHRRLAQTAPSDSSPVLLLFQAQKAGQHAARTTSQKPSAPTNEPSLVQKRTVTKTKFPQESRNQILSASASSRKLPLSDKVPGRCDGMYFPSCGWAVDQKVS